MGKRRQTVRNKKRKYTILMLTGFLAAGTACFIYFGSKYLRNAIKDRICGTVIKYEKELSETVEVCRGEGFVFLVREKDVYDNDAHFTEKGYEVVGSEAVSEMFKVFQLVYIEYASEDVITFVVQPSPFGILWNTWAYGFYYSVDGTPKGALTGITVMEESVDEMKGEGDVPVFGGYWYKTERISGNWWFFESVLKEGFIKRNIRICRNKKYIL